MTDEEKEIIKAWRRTLIAIPVLVVVGIPACVVAAVFFGEALEWVFLWMIKPVVWLFEVLPSP